MKELVDVYSKEELILCMYMRCFVIDRHDYRQKCWVAESDITNYDKFKNWVVVEIPIFDRVRHSRLVRLLYG